MSDYRMRQQDIIPEEKISDVSVTIIGCGGIGSHTALALARMGVKHMTIIDPDKVSKHNVSSQGFDIADVGKYKVDVTRDKIVRAARIVPTISKQLVTEATKQFTTDIVIAAVDNQQARKVILEKCGYNTRLINPAMGAEFLTMNVYDMVSVDDIADFKKTWFSDDDGVQETCTAKATIYTTLLVSSYIAKVVKDTVTENSYVKTMSYDIANNTPILMYNSKGINLLE